MNTPDSETVFSVLLNLSKNSCSYAYASVDNDLFHISFFKPDNTDLYQIMIERVNPSNDNAVIVLNLYCQNKDKGFTKLSRDPLIINSKFSLNNLLPIYIADLRLNSINENKSSQNKHRRSQSCSLQSGLHEVKILYMKLINIFGCS